MNPITLKVLAPKEKGCQLTTLARELKKGVVLTLVPREESAAICPCGVRNVLDENISIGNVMNCKGCGEVLVSHLTSARQHVRVSFSELSDENAIILDERLPKAFISVPSPSYLYLFNHSKFKEDIQVMWE